jgi:hypothetical protein
LNDAQFFMIMSAQIRRAAEWRSASVSASLSALTAAQAQSRLDMLQVCVNVSFFGFVGWFIDHCEFIRVTFLPRWCRTRA